MPQEIEEGYYYTYMSEDGWRIYEYKIMSWGSFFFACGSDVAYDVSVFDQVKPVPMPKSDEL